MAAEFGSGDSWTILSPIEQSIKRKIEAVGVPLKDWDVKINRGILTGCNEAFIINGAKRAELISKDPKSDEIIRPILRGRDIKRYGYEFADQYVIAAHNGYCDENGNEIPPINIDDYIAIKTHLDEYWDIISVRADKGITPYNLRNCAYMDDFSKQKIYWGEFSAFPKFSYVPETYYALNNMSFIVGSELEMIVGCLNSAITAYYAAHNNPYGMGAYKWYQVYTGAIPILRITETTKQKLLPLVWEMITTGDNNSYTKINEGIFDIIGLTDEERFHIYAFIKKRQNEIKNA